MTTATVEPRTFTAARDDRSAAGTSGLVRMVLRRDRIKLPAWLLGLTIFVFYVNTALPVIAPNEEDLSAFSQFIEGPVGAVVGGPGYGLDGDLTYQVFFINGYGLYFLLVAALMNILLISRHTRVEEQSGRAELVRASVVGRNAPLSAALIVAVMADVVLAILLAGATMSFGYPAHGSLLFGAGVGAAGLVFAGVTAVTVQVTEYSRAASGLAGIVLGAAYVMRAAGDSITEHGSALSWLSPLAWSQQTRPYVDERWWPLLLSLALAATTAAIGYALAARRDIGAGLTAPRPGPARAAPWLRSPATIALRLQRAGILGWMAALAVLGLTYGLLLTATAEMSADLSEDFTAIIGAQEDIINGYLSFMALYHTIIVAVFGILAVQGMRAEETQGRAEPVLATPNSRPAWFGTSLAVAGAAAALILTVTGLAFGVGAAISDGDAGLIWELTAAHLARVPEVLVFMGIAALLYGIAPRALPLAWVVLVYATVLALFGPLLDLPAFASNLSPLDHVARMPLEDLTAAPLVILTAVAAATAVAGTWAFRRRDLASTA